MLISSLLLFWASLLREIKSPPTFFFPTLFKKVLMTTGSNQYRRRRRPIATPSQKVIPCIYLAAGMRRYIVDDHRPFGTCFE